MDGFNQIQSEFIGVRCSDLPSAAFHVVKLWPFWTRAHLSSLQATNLCQKIQIYWNLKNDVASCDIMNGLFCFPAFFLPWMTDAYGFARISLDSSYHWFGSSEVHGMPGANLCMQPPCNHRRQWNLLPDCTLIGFFQCICWGSWTHCLAQRISPQQQSAQQGNDCWFLCAPGYGHQPSLAIYGQAAIDLVLLWYIPVGAWRHAQWVVYIAKRKSKNSHSF